MDNQKRQVSGLVLPLVLLLVSLAFVFVIVPAQTKVMHVTGDLEPASFPTAAFALIALLSAILLVQELVKPTAERPGSKVTGMNRRDLLLLVVTGAVLFVYIQLIKFLGFYSASLIAMFLALLKYDRMKWYYCLLTTLIFLLACYLLFQLGLRLSLPTGILR